MKLLAISVSAVLIAGFAASASAQNIDKLVLSPDAAKKTLIRNEINAETAEKIAKACENFAREHNVAVSVFILNPTGQIIHAHAMDGQVPINIDTGLMKAQSVLFTRDSTHKRANMVAGNLALQMRWGNIGVFPTSGGLPIIADGQMIGAIGVGGSNVDEQCAYEALTQVVGPQPPLEPNTPPAGRGAQGQPTR